MLLDCGCEVGSCFWIGTSAYTPVGASYVPPPPEEVPTLLEDLMAFVNRVDVPPLLQAGIAHAQFETIHPFGDGNGRVGRALIHAILRRRGVAPEFVPPVSAVLARSRDSYFDGLSAWRHVGPGDDPARDRGAEEWLGLFLEAIQDACGEAHAYLHAVSSLETDLRARAGPVRRGSSTDLLLGVLAACPIFTVNSAAEMIQRSNRRYRPGRESARRVRCAQSTDCRQSKVPGVRSTRRHPSHHPARQRSVVTKPRRQGIAGFRWTIPAKTTPSGPTAQQVSILASEVSQPKTKGPDIPLMCDLTGYGLPTGPGPGVIGSSMCCGSDVDGVAIGL